MTSTQLTNHRLRKSNVKLQEQSTLQCIHSCIIWILISCWFKKTEYCDKCIDCTNVSCTVKDNLLCFRSPPPLCGWLDLHPLDWHLQAGASQMPGVLRGCWGAQRNAVFRPRTLGAWRCGRSASLYRIVPQFSSRFYPVDCTKTRGKQLQNVLLERSGIRSHRPNTFWG